MKAQVSKGILAASLLFGLTACGGTSQSKSNAVHNPTTKTETVDHEQVTWQVFKGVDFSKKSKGLEVKITKIAVAKKIPNIEVGYEKTPAVKVTYKFHNYGPHLYKVDPTQAVLVTPTDDPTRAASHISDDWNGKLKPGETKTCTVGYYLSPETKFSKLKWLELKFTATLQLPDKVREQHIDTGKIKIRPN
ncbi:MAG TPA: hypothetical protein VFK37_03600 [Bacillales bacterium]|nr:hypothetical protein [Bacillales bacterium]